MSPIDPSALPAIQARLARNRAPQAAAAADTAKAEKWAAGEEKSLQDEIEKYANVRGWFVLRSRMNKRTTFTVQGFPDLAVFGPHGVCVLLEVKTKYNDLSDDQKTCHLALKTAGANVETVWNLAEAIEVLRAYLDAEYPAI